MIWYKIISHDYMDEKPEIGFRLFKDSDEAKAYEKHMQDNWSGGTTNLAGPATQQEILDYLKRWNITPDELTMSNINNKEYYQL